MFLRIIAFSLRQKYLVLLAVIAMAAAGIYSATYIPLDAVPDITNNQVQVVTVSPTLAPQEVEQRVTFPIEQTMSNLPDIQEIRSISRYGLSVVTIVFSEDVPVLTARQLVREQLDLIKGTIPEELGNPELMPITTGLGEIFQYTLEVDDGYKDVYGVMELRTIQDWIVKRQLAGVPGIIEVSSFGGYVKQYEVALKPDHLRAFEIPVSEVLNALKSNNENAGSAYIEKAEKAQYIRTIGQVMDFDDIGNIPLATRKNRPIYIKDIADMRYGHAKRYGAMTMDGEGEVVGGITLMLKGSNSFKTVQRVKDRIFLINKSLPEGIHLQPYLDRASLVSRTIQTVQKNLIEGGLIVILILILLLGNFRAGLIVASIIPLSLLFAFIMMRWFNVSANLMSLGAIDFGIVVDGAVIIVEGIMHFLIAGYVGKKLSGQEMDDAIKNVAGKIYSSAFFGVLIILVVFIPVMTLQGIEGKTFRPMAQVMSFALIGAMLLSLTYVPVASSMFLSKRIKQPSGISENIMNFLKKAYKPSLLYALNKKYLVVAISAFALAFTIWLFPRLGAEFIPTLEEGDLAMQMTIQPGSSLTKSIDYTSRAERLLMDHFPEVDHVVSKIGTAEVPTDPMAIEDADIMILLKPKSEWQTAQDREALVDSMKNVLEAIPGASFEFTQPIQLRFNELMTGAKTDIAIIIYGEELDRLAKLGEEVTILVNDVPGVGDVRLEQTEGLPQAMVKYKRENLAMYGIAISEMNDIVRTAFAGSSVGAVYENERSFDLVARLSPDEQKLGALDKLVIPSKDGQFIPFHHLASVEWQEGPMQISRDNARRRISVGINVRGRDTESLVGELRTKLNQSLKLPPGYTIEFGGQFENLQAARSRLLIVVPVALILIWILLFASFNSASLATLIFTAVPLSSIGGVLALWVRGMPFSISAAVGFIALFGVAVLNGIVLISYFNQLKRSGMKHKEIVIEGSTLRLRPVLMTALVAALGFLPMAISTSAGAEVQKPLATVVIGGLISATLLTLILLPVLYHWLFDPSRNIKMSINKNSTMLVLLLIFFIPYSGMSQQAIELDQLIAESLEKDPALQASMTTSKLYLAEKRKAYEFGDIQLGFSHGEINAPVQDEQWDIGVDLGNILGIKRRSGAANAQAMVQDQQTEILKKDRILNITTQWHQCIYLLRKQERLSTRLMEANKALEIIELQLEVGEISGNEKALIQQDISLLQLEASMTETELEKELSLLSAYGFQNEIISPATEGWTDLPSPPDSAVLNNDWSVWWDAKEDAADKMYSANITKFNPTPRVGATIAQIEKMNGLFSWTVGLNVPLNPSGFKYEKEKYQLTKTRIKQERRAQIWQQTKRVEQLMRSINIQWKLLENRPEQPEDAYMSPWIRSFELGETGFLQYRQALDSFYARRDREDEFILKYYLTLAELEYLMQ